MSQSHGPVPLPVHGLYKGGVKVHGSVTLRCWSGADLASQLVTPGSCLIMNHSKMLICEAPVAKSSNIQRPLWKDQLDSDTKILTPLLITPLCLWSGPRWHLRDLWAILTRGGSSVLKGRNAGWRCGWTSLMWQTISMLRLCSRIWWIKH